MRWLWQKGTNDCGPLHNFLPWKREKKRMWICEFVKLWIRESVNSWNCEFMKLWIHEIVNSWNCEYVKLWIHEIVNSWNCEFVKLWIREVENSCGGYDKKKPIILANWKNCMNFTKVYWDNEQQSQAQSDGCKIQMAFRSARWHWEF